MSSLADRFENSDKAEQIDTQRRGLRPISNNRIEDERALERARKGPIDTTKYSDSVTRR